MGADLTPEGHADHLRLARQRLRIHIDAPSPFPKGGPPKEDH